MRRALKDKLANYKIPQEFKVVEDIPKNAMGKSELREESACVVQLLIRHLSQQEKSCEGSIWRQGGNLMRKKGGNGLHGYQDLNLGS